MSALKKRVVAIVMLPSTWKRTPGCCKLISSRRFNVTRRHHRVLGEEGLLRAQALRRRRRDARLLRRRDLQDLDELRKHFLKGEGLVG